MSNDRIGQFDWDIKPGPFVAGDIVHFGAPHHHYIVLATRDGYPCKVYYIAGDIYYDHDRLGGVWPHAKLVREATPLERAVYENPK